METFKLSTRPEAWGTCHGERTSGFCQPWLFQDKNWRKKSLGLSPIAWLVIWHNYNIMFAFKWTHYLHVLVSSTHHNLCKQIGPRSVLTKCWAWFGPNVFDGIPERFFWKSWFWKNLQTTKNMKNFHMSKELKWICC